MPRRATRARRTRALRLDASQFRQWKPTVARGDPSRGHETRLDLDETRTKLASEDLIHFDREGKIAVAYPFSGRPSRHRILVEGHTVHAMCAVDALGIAPMFEQAIVINSRDPLTDAEISVWLQPDGTGTWEPNEAVVVVGHACAGAAFQGCCQVLNFFASHENAERYLLEHEDVNGFPITIPEAIELGRVIFGDALEQI